MPHTDARECGALMQVANSSGLSATASTAIRSQPASRVIASRPTVHLSCVTISRNVTVLNGVSYALLKRGECAREFDCANPALCAGDSNFASTLYLCKYKRFKKRCHMCISDPKMARFAKRLFTEILRRKDPDSERAMTSSSIY